MLIWIKRYAQKNLWRMPPFFDLEDLIQEGYMVYSRCNQHYPMTLRQKHFMALVQRSFANRIHRLANARTAMIKEIAMGAGPEFEREMEFFSPTEPEEASFMTLFGQLPDEIMAMFTTIMNDARNIPMLVYSDGRRETTKEYLARICGLPEDIDVEALLRSYLSEDKGYV
jgi:hypothetical protein